MLIHFEEIGIRLGSAQWGSFAGTAEVEADGTISTITLEDFDVVRGERRARQIEIGPSGGADTVIYHLLVPSIRQAFAEKIASYVASHHRPRRFDRAASAWGTV